MRNRVILQNEEINSNEILKTTSLLYLEEALRKEEYESCRELLEAARKFGALKSEIKKVLEVSFRTKRGGSNEANLGKNRLHKLKERK